MMNKHTTIVYLKICVFLVFIGRAYQHLFWDAPFRSVLWDQRLLEAPVEYFLNMSWQEYVTDLQIDNYIQLSIKGFGVLYLICAILSLIISESSKRWMRIVIGIGGTSLILLALILTKAKFYHVAMFFEHSIQFGIPFILIYILKLTEIRKLLIPINILIALTFICHGLYALGYIYPLPGNFVTMTLNLLPVNEPFAKQFLFIVGVLDIIIAILIFIPKMNRYALIYAGIWGLLTAFARISSGFSYDLSITILHQYLFETLYRIPHGLLPFIVYQILKTQRTNVSTIQLQTN